MEAFPEASASGVFRGRTNLRIASTASGECTCISVQSMPVAGSPKTIIPLNTCDRSVYRYDQ
jgi:hypothetical protein